MIILDDSQTKCGSCGGKGMTVVTLKLKQVDKGTRFNLCKEREETLVEMLQDDLGVQP